MLRLYLDDAGNQDEAGRPVFALGGYIATEATWRNFTHHWRHVLGAFGLVAYHAADCEAGQGEFKGWSPGRRLDLKLRLVQIIDRHRLVAVARGVHVPDFNDVLLHDEAHRDITGSAPFYPIVYCLHACLDWIASEWAYRPQGERIAVVCEEGSRGTGALQEAYRWVKREMMWARIFDTIAFAEKDTMPLQAADMFAHEAYKALENEWAGRPRPQRKLLTALAPGPDYISIKYGTRANLEEEARAFKAYRARPLEP